jgi:hypothetical protein
MLQLRAYGTRSKLLRCHYGYKYHSLSNAAVDEAVTRMSFKRQEEEGEEKNLDETTDLILYNF